MQSAPAGSVRRAAAAGRGSGAIRHAELAVDVVEVLLDRAGRDPQALGDGRVAEPAGHELEDLGLSRGETLDVGRLRHRGPPAQMRRFANATEVRPGELEHRSIAR